MSDKYIAMAVGGNDETTDKPLALGVVVDFIAKDDVYFTLRTREPFETPGFTGGECIRQFYIPNDQARRMARFILDNTYRRTC